MYNADGVVIQVTADPYATLLTVLISVFNTLDFSLPSIVLGDFNEDFSPLALNDPDTTRLGRFMRDNSYNQLVKKCTTDRGTLIDHIYFNRTAGDIDTKVCDCYYSDHDVVLLCTSTSSRCSALVQVYSEYCHYTDVLTSSSVYIHLRSAIYIV